MRRDDKRIKDKKFIESILQEADHCTIALCDGKIPYIVPMNFGFKDNTLYLHSFKEGRKIDILKSNNQISFSMEIKTELVKSESPCSYGMKYMSVTGFGFAYFIDDSIDKIEALNILMDKYSNNEDFKKYEYSETMLNEVVVVRIEITKLTGKISGY